MLKVSPWKGVVQFGKKGKLAPRFVGPFEDPDEDCVCGNIGRIPDISYFYMFGCPMFIYNHKDHLGKFDAKANDRYFLGYSFNSKAFRVFNTRRKQIEETYHVTFDESMEAIRFTNTLVDEIGIDDSSRYPPDDYHHEDDPSRQYQSNSDISYYVISHGRSLIELTQEKHVPEVIAQNEQDNPHNEVVEGPPGPTDTEGIQEQNDIRSKDQHIKLINIIGDPGEGMLTRSMAAKLIAASAIWTLVPLLYGKIAIGSKWVFRNKKDEHGIVTKNKARLVTQGYSQEDRIDYDTTFATVARMEAIMIFLTFATNMNFTIFQMDVKSVFLNGKIKEEVYVKHPPSFESSEFSDYDDKGISICQEQYTRNLLKKYEIFDSSSVKTPMVPPNNLGHDLAGKPVNETLYRGMIRSLMYLTTTRYLKGTPSLSLYYPKCSGFDLKGYSNSNYVGCNMDRKSTSDAWKRDCVERIPSDYCSEDQYAVSIKEDMAYMCLHSPKTTKGMKINTPYTQIDIDYAAGGNLRRLSAEEAWETIEDCAQYDRKCSNPTSVISDETIANPNAQIVGDDMVRVQVTDI
ncbi:retrovirus-related pol polyprotein from transposon TNT 1-94 [Tanacetum coccineum]